MNPLLLVTITVAALLPGCSDKDKAAESKRDHAWKTQTQSIDKARSAEDEIGKAFGRRDKETDRQSR